MGVTDAANAETVTKAHVQLGKMSPEHEAALQAARGKGKESMLTNAKNLESMPMWKLFKNWIPEECCGQSLMLKVQLPLDGEAEDSMCMAYDEKRQFNLNISKANCPKAEFLALIDIISKNGSANGMKAYLPAQLPAKPDGEMVLDFEGLVPKLQW
eukprot:gene1102-697_t